MLKKLILRPRKDTITICLPPDWVGKPLTCIIRTDEGASEEIVSQVSEDAIRYQRLKYRRRRRRHVSGSRRRH